MKDTYHPHADANRAVVRLDAPAIDVPWADVLRSRADFPQARLSFHLDLLCDGLPGLAALSQGLADSGLQLRPLRASENGAVRCVLVDEGTADLSQLARSLPEAALLLAWVTQIEFQSAAPAG